MEKYDVIIIGAGVGGLVCGNILAKNGLKVLIIEKNQVNGGGVSTFYRNGYPLDITHSVCGLGKESFLGKVFDYLGIYDNFEFIENEKAFIYYSGADVKPVFCYTELDKYKDELKVLFPEQKPGIDSFFNAVESVWSKEVLKSYYNPSMLKLFLYPFSFPHLLAWRNYTFDDLLNKFIKEQKLKEIISVICPYLGLDKEYVSGLYAACLIGAYHRDKNYFVKGGFGKIPEGLTVNFKKSGGQVINNTEIKKITINNNTASGVMDKNNNLYYADRIISNVDSKKTFLDLIDKAFLPPETERRISKLSMSYSGIQVYLAAQADIDKNLLSAGSIVFPSPIDIEAKLKAPLKLDTHLHHTPSFVLGIHRLEDFITSEQKDKYIFNIGYFPANYSLWKQFRDTHGEEEYKNLKIEITDSILTQIKRKFTIKEVKFTDILTPLSYAKWLNATDGAIYDLALSPRQTLLNRPSFRTHIKNLFLVGTKTFPGNSVAGAAISAVALSDLLLGERLTKGKFILNPN